MKDYNPTGDARVNEALLLSRECFRHLEGHAPRVQGAAIAELLAHWLAGHVVFDKRENIERQTTTIVRDAQLDLLLATMRKLVPIAEAEIMATKNERKRWERP